jgi:hypothetical protein
VPDRLSRFSVTEKNSIAFARPDKPGHDDDGGAILISSIGFARHMYGMPLNTMISFLNLLDISNEMNFTRILPLVSRFLASTSWLGTGLHVAGRSLM